MSILKNILTAIARAVDFCSTALAVPLVLMLRLAKPLWTVRFGYFDADRIGHFAFDSAFYLATKAAVNGRKTKDIFFFNREPANQYFASLCKRSITIAPWVRYLWRADQLLRSTSDHRIYPARCTHKSRDVIGILSECSPIFSFYPAEMTRGQVFLKRIGCSKDQGFVCLLARDSTYLKSTDPKRDWSYHDYRNTLIGDYAQAAIALADLDYFVLRMGNMVESRLCVDHPLVIDYATSEFRTDFLDIWLTANCRFCISTGTGLDEVALIFGRPAVYVNYLPAIDVVSYSQNVTVFKHLEWKDRAEPLSLSEHLVHSYNNSFEYADNGIAVKDLTPVEIKDAVLELEARLKGEWDETARDRIFQNRFWDILKKHPNYQDYHGFVHPQARIGAAFLSANHNLFLQ